MNAKDYLKKENLQPVAQETIELMEKYAAEREKRIAIWYKEPGKPYIVCIKCEKALKNCDCGVN
jgi:hypothetical protein